MPVDYNALLAEKLNKEFLDLQAELEEMLPQEIIAHSYEIVIKDDIIRCCEYGNLPQEQAKALYRLKNPLDDLYREWLDTDVSYMDMLRDVIDTRAVSAVKEMREAQRESR